MERSSTIALTTNIADVPGVGRQRADAFRNLGIRSVADLIRHLPMRYEHELAEQAIRDAVDAAALGANVTVRGEVARVRPGRGRRSRLEATLEDDTGTLLLTWFNAPWMRGRLHPGMTIRATGKATLFGEYLQMVNPRWETIADGAAAPLRPEGERAVYPASEDITSRAIETAIGAVLDHATACVADHLPEAFLAERDLIPLADAYRQVHRPRSDDEARRARRRLAFDDLFMLQLGVMLKRRHRRDVLQAPALRHTDEIRRHITARFPFELTGSQRVVIDEIVADLAVPLPMNRLLQGDVGSGKTVVALYAMLTAVASGHQAALMAPTELLAEQHHASITAMLEGSSVTVELLTAALRRRERAHIVERLATGDAHLLVGTHALLTGDVAFQSLAVAVIDEQHRFGVHQRATLRAKAERPGETEPSLVPHVLVMTATPIPRTMSLTIFGDLDISTIRELPPGRRPVATRCVKPDQADAVYAEVDERLAAGEQAYIVVPVIDESEAGLTDLTSHLERLAAGPLASRRLAAMHGRLSREERDEVMGRFRAGAVDALVATTVIEVGVDVPNASIMVIEHADRFGLAQLHQLRGRVGRGARDSVCILIANPTTEEGARRIEAIRTTGDGFEIAERDLQIRGPGELFGPRQSGAAPFLAADLTRDMELLKLARRDAARWIEENPRLSGERDALLKKRLLKAYGKTLGLGDVG